MRLLPVVLLLTIAYCCVYASSQEEEDNQATTAVYTEAPEIYEDDIIKAGGNITEQVKDVENSTLSKSSYCGHCRYRTSSRIQRPCYRYRYVKYTYRRRCGFWRRRHWCNRTRWRKYVYRYCCRPSFLKYYIIGYRKYIVCYRR